MYLDFFKLDRFPFNNNPDPAFLCMLPQSREALACLKYGVVAKKGFMVLLGEVGTGKTTLLRTVMNSMRSAQVHTSFIFNPQMDVLDFLETMLADFGVPVAARTKSSMLMQLNRWLVERFAAGDTCALIVDEAQSLSVELLEEIRLLTNLETDSEKLLQIVLSGQPELEATLRNPAMRQLRQRIALWCRTKPLTESETEEYIQQRLALAGSKKPVFDAEAVSAIHRYSSGTPRLINLICEHALILSYVERLNPVPAAVVYAVAVDLELNTAHPLQDRHGHAGQFQASPIAEALLAERKHA